MTWHVPPYRWAAPCATNVAAELRREPADVVGADLLVPDALVAAEALGVPSVSLVHGIYKHRPAEGLPPYGSGFGLAHAPWERLRDALWSMCIQRAYTRDALPVLNQARSHFGLLPLSSMYDQFDRAARVLVLTDRAFDFNARSLPDNVHYIGTPIDDTASGVWKSPWPQDDHQPLVVVSLSTLQQGQAPVLQRVLTAVADLPVKALVRLTRGSSGHLQTWSWCRLHPIPPSCHTPRHSSLNAASEA